MDTNLLIFGCLFSCVGLGFFTYGKKQRSVVPLGCGIGLMIFPYFISDIKLVLLIGIALMLIPYFVRID